MAGSEKKGPGRAILTVAASVTLTALAILIFIYRDYLTPESIGAFFAGERPALRNDSPFSYEASQTQAFALAGDGLAVASSSGIRLYDGDGGLVASQIMPLSSPAVAASDKYAVFFDVGGKTLRLLYFDGEIKNLDTDRTIIWCGVNKNGWMCVITEEAGYRGRVSVYNSGLNLVYEWYSGSRYVLSAEVSPDNRYLAVLCVGMEGGAAVMFSLSSDEEYGSIFTPDELLFDMKFISNDRICAISEERAVFFGVSGDLVGEYGFDGLFLTDYTFCGDSFVGLLLGRYRSGNEGLLVTLDSGGEMLGELEVINDHYSLSASGSSLLTLTADGLTLYSSRLAEKRSAEDISGVKSALLLADEAALLISPYAAEKRNF